MQKLFVLVLLCWHLYAKAQCDTTLRPVIFIHGFLASGDTWSNALHSFRLAGYCNDRLYIFDWNSLNGNAAKTDSMLAALIDHALRSSGMQQVDLVGHSAGGGLARNYLKDSLHGSKVAHYVHIGSRKWKGEFNWFPNSKCLNIFSAGDRVAGAAAGPIDGAQNRSLQDEDHYQVATGAAAVQAMYAFFQNHRMPELKSSFVKNVQISGKAVTLGDNLPIALANIRIYPLHKKTGARIQPRSPVILQTGTNGSWGPVSLQTGVAYEFELEPTMAAQRRISYFFPEFRHTDPAVYLRGFPQGSQLKTLLGQLPEKEDQSLLVLYGASQAMIGNRDSVTVNEMPVCSAALTPASKTAITSFIYDDGDQISSGGTLKNFSGMPFITGTDLLLEAGDQKRIVISYNGQQLVIPARPSKERILLAVFR